jgi:Protein of unknown function (DUF2829)
MNFGEAIEALKKGLRVRRSGWNGVGMHIYLEDWCEGALRVRIGGIERSYEPVICMFTAHGKHQPGWLASQADMLGEDWEIVQ